MLDISEGFINKALEHGRHVFCRIECDGVVFYDDTITDFTFDDVVHPDWFTYGTACANRVHFTVRYSGVLSPDSEVKPYISFDGEEWCPLGIFYITRRYVRGQYVSVTAYDRMYQLEQLYSYEGELPTDSHTILDDICARFGISKADVGYHHTVHTLPTEDTTVRDMLGYIAGIDGACAKFDRSGDLCFKDHRMITFSLTDSSCFEFSRNMTQSVVTCLKAQTEGELLTAGSGAEISTVEMYNPLMTQTRLEQLHSMAKPFSFYGAELEMQGLPFLEAGDCLYFLDGLFTYPLVISEIEYHYNGGLSATLYSKNKTESDIIGLDDLESILDKLQADINVFCMKQHNTAMLTLTEEPSVIADFSFIAAGGGFAQLDISFNLHNYTSSGVEFGLFVNGEGMARVPQQYLSQGDCLLLHLHELVKDIPEGNCHIYATARAKDGEAYIFAGELAADIVVHGGHVPAGGILRASFYDKLEPPCISFPVISYGELHDNVETAVT